jgi:arabinan endo-1,5-alpha-L-arabinosidase
MSFEPAMAVVSAGMLPDRGGCDGRRLIRAIPLFAALAACNLFSALPAKAYPDPLVVAGDTALTLDPALVIRGGTPRYILYTTENQTRVSADRTVWLNAGPSFPTLPPAWTQPYSNGNIWAPDVSYHDGKYWMYFTASTPVSQHSAIGLATSPTGESGSWTDRGMVIDSDWNDGHNYNALDPNLLVDSDGRWWLTFGSFWDGLYTVELDPATGKLKSGATPTNVARRTGPQDGTSDAIEASFVFRHGGYYYLFASFDKCCQADPTYNIRVARATSPTGPYIDRNGVNMLNGGGTIVLESHGYVRGPGGQSVVHDPSDNSDLLVYHWYDQRANYTQFLGLNYLGWDAQGWPFAF